MKLKYVPLAIVVGILAAIWTWVSIKLSLPTWAGFMGWAFFFVAGSDNAALWKASLPGVVGVILGHLSLYGLKLPGEMGVIGISVLVGLAALILVLAMNWAPMALAPAGFVWFAAFFAFAFGKFAGDNFFSFSNILFTLIGLLVGVILGWLSVKITGLVTKKA